MGLIHNTTNTQYNKSPSSQGYGFSSSHVWMWKLDCKESWVLKNWNFWTVVLEKTLESPLDCKEIQPVNPKGNQSWELIRKTDAEGWSSNILASWCEKRTHWKRPRCWERLKAGGKGDDRGRDGWMASLTQRTWVWVSSRGWWWTGKPGMLQSMGVTEIWTRLSDWNELREYVYSNRKFHASHTKTLKFMNELGKIQG